MIYYIEGISSFQKSWHHKGLAAPKLRRENSFRKGEMTYD